MEVSVLSKEMQFAIVQTISETFEKQMSRLEEMESTQDIMRQKDVVEKFGIDAVTLRKWESLGLKRYSPPIERTKSVYYRYSEIVNFLDNN